ncbi:glycosyltransferase [Helicobacter canis]|uniref:glycosyltransferase n=1 Tax=Helicobacter canis TaxID=29419 RepID=UPI00294236DA|nr:glycosyltransferase [Helicobacter canis]
MPACQNLDSSTKPTRLTVCFDARALMHISRASANRSGITLSAYQVLLALSKICEVKLFCELEFYTLCKRECAKLESLKGFSFVNRFSLVERALSYLCYQKYSICHYLRERNHPILDRAMRAVFLPFIILARYHKLGSSTLESMQSCDILFSPYYAFAKEIAALDSVRFTLLHDVIPIVYEEHFRMSDIPIDKLLRQVLRQVLRQRHDFYDIADSLNVKDFYITNSAFTKADFLKHFPTRLCESHISVALLGADREIFYRDFDERKNAQIRERYHIPHNTRYIFSLCSLDPRKNLIFVARNFIECIKKHNINDLVLVLGGGAWESFIGELESSFESLGELRGKIRRAGYVDDSDLANLFSHSLASVYLSTYEGFGLPVLESMSCGCPTIASSTTSVPEVLGSGGIALDPNDALGLQEAIYKIYSDESYARELSQRALEQADKFSWEKCAREMYSAFSHALGEQDSACSDKSAIASSTLRLRTPSARPCVDSQSPDLLKKPAAALPCTATAGFVGCAWRGVGEGIYLSGNEQAHAADSRKSAQNKRSGASVSSQVSLEKPTPPLASDYMEYYMFDEPAWNTFDPQVAQNSLGKLQRIVKVPLLTLGEVLHTYVPKGVEIDFLSIDCEGFDLAVLESNDWDSFVPHIIIVEILTNIYGELDMVALQDNEIARFLFSKGYALVAKAHNSVIFQHKDRR